MTTIVVTPHFIAADSQETTGSGLAMVNKISEPIDGLFVALTGYSRQADLLEYASFDPPYPGTDMRKWAVTKFVPVVREAFTMNGFTETDSGSLNMGLFVAYKGRAFSVGSNLAVREVTEFEAMGSGGNYAAGALSILNDPSCAAGLSEKDVELAISIAARYDIYTGGPIKVVRHSEEGSQK